jgi:hypothetical protein
LAFASTGYGFQAQLEQTSHDIPELGRGGQLRSEDLRGFCNKFGLDMSPGCNFPVSIGHWARQAICTRDDLGVAMASNHLEWLHRALSETDIGIVSTTRRLAKVIDMVHVRYCSALGLLMFRETDSLRHSQRNRPPRELRNVGDARIARAAGGSSRPDSWESIGSPASRRSAPGRLTGGA